MAARTLAREDQWPGLASIAAVEAEAAHKHWGIENSLPWVLDVIMNEDQNHIRKDHAPENMALMRRLVLNRIKKTKPRKASVRASIKKPAGTTPSWRPYWSHKMRFPVPRPLTLPNK